MNLNPPVYGAISVLRAVHSAYGAETMPEHLSARSFGKGEVESSILSGSTIYLSDLADDFGSELRFTRTLPGSANHHEPDRSAPLLPLTGGGRTVAALYIQADGCYADLPGVDLWPIERDARTYAGPHPVVAHPPCQRWGAMANVNFARWGGEHNRPGNDGGCFAAALAAVRRWGGVLEHPATSRAFVAHDLPPPRGIGWQRSDCGGWVCEVWQSAYGHRANKATWLYAFGIGLPPQLNWSRPVGTHQVGFQDQRGKARNKPTLSQKEAAATPPAFRDLLLSIARTAITGGGRHG